MCKTVNQQGVDSLPNELSNITIGGSPCIIVSDWMLVKN